MNMEREIEKERKKVYIGMQRCPLRFCSVSRSRTATTLQEKVQDLAIGTLCNRMSNMEIRPVKRFSTFCVRLIVP